MSHRAKGCQGYAKRIMKAEAKVVQKKRREKGREKGREKRQGEASQSKAAHKVEGKW